jgi:hypothetical protein
MTPRLVRKVLPFPARPAAPYPPAGLDASRSPQQHLALRGAWLDGQDHGERLGYVAGWRWGALTGACVMALLAAAALAAALGLGWLQPGIVTLGPL